MTTLYVAGPMTGLPNYNYPAFEKAAGDLIVAGYEVLSPHTIDATEGTAPGSQTWEWYMRRALSLMLRCDGVALLPGWRNSRGASIEVSVADEVGMDPVTVGAWLLRARAARAGLAFMSARDWFTSNYEVDPDPGLEPAPVPREPADCPHPGCLRQIHPNQPDAHVRWGINYTHTDRTEEKP